MRIAIFQHTLNPTVIGWVRGLERSGHEVVNVIAYDTEPVGGWPSDLDVVILPNTSWRTNRVMRRLSPSTRKASYAFASFRSVRRFLLEQRIDLALVKIYSLRNVIVMLVALTRRIRRIAWAEGTAPPNRKWRVLRAIGVVPRAWFVTNHHRVGELVDPTRSHRRGAPVIPYAPAAIHPDHPRSPGGGSPRPLRVLVVSAFWDVDAKRPGWVLEAAHRAGILEGSARFAFVGAGKEPSSVLDGLRRRVAELDVDALVDVRLNVPFVEMDEIYADHDLLVLPSLREQFGMVVPEAMAHGLAVIASDAVGCRGLVVPERTGLVFAVDDLDGLTAALGRLVADPAEVRRMGEAGRALIGAHASAEVAAERLLALVSRRR